MKLYRDSFMSRKNITIELLMTELLKKTNRGIGNMVNVKIKIFNLSSFFIAFCSFLQGGRQSFFQNYVM